MKKAVKKNLYTVLDARVIDCLGGICGPIQHPIEIAESDVITMVRNGFTVYQHNPHNLREKVKVTRLNFNSIVFKTTRYDGYKSRSLNTELRNEAKKVSAPAPKKDKDNKKKSFNDEKVETEKPTSMDFESQS